MKAIKAWAIVDKNGDIGKWVIDNHTVLLMTCDDKAELVRSKHSTDKVIPIEIHVKEGRK